MQVVTKKMGTRSVKEIKGNGGEALFAKADVTKATEIKAVVDKIIEAFGHIDILYNGAGIHDSYKMAVEIEEDEYDKLMAVKVKGPC